MLTSTFVYNLASTELKSLIFQLYKLDSKTNILDRKYKSLYKYNGSSRLVPVPITDIVITDYSP